ncbi:MAG TPA: alpha/beta fold hydrolase [Candidatus Limnocylindrales bacterium]|nr:alpha/beta fold hydrolase [Candidatus Limnocylindrales bacterium]
MIRAHLTTTADGPEHWLEAGRGPDVFLFPSPLIRGHTYAGLIEALSGFHVVAADAPGSGLSAPVPAPWSFEQYMEWLDSFLDTAGLRRPIVIAHSNSAMPALLLASLRPSRLSQLILADPVGFQPRMSYLNMIARRAMDALDEPGVTVAGTPHLLRNLAAHTRSFLTHARASIDADWSAYGLRVQVPTLIAWGARDKTTSFLDSMLRARELIPHAATLISPRGSHDWLIERPGEFAHFVRSLPSGDASSPGAA